MKRLPDCISGKGCEIGEDLALDREVNHTIDMFLVAKRSPSAQKSSHVYDSLLKQAGLYDNLELLFELEGIYHNYEALEMERQNQLTQLQSRSRGR